MAGKAKKVSKLIREQVAELKRKQRERMKAAGETPQSLKKKRDRRRAEAARPRTSKASRTTPNGETTVPKRPGKDLVVSKPRQLPATIKPANKAVAIRKNFDIKPNVKNSKIEEVTKGATSKAERMSKLKKAGLLAAGGAAVAAIGVGTGGKKTKTATASTDKGTNKTTTTKKTTTATKPKKERRLKGKFLPKIRPFGGKIAKVLLGKDEQFGGEAGLIDPDLGLGVRRKAKGGPVRKMSKGGPLRKMSKGGPLRKMSKGGNLKKVGADQKGLQKLPTAVRNKMGYMKDGGMPKKKGYAKGGPVRKMSKGGTARRGSPRGVGVAKRGFGKALRRR